MLLIPEDIDRVQRAIRLGCKVHENDSWGEFPYSVHLSLVALEARLLAPENPLVEAAAWLHDVIEDHPEYTETVKNEFPELYEIITIVSRNDSETYEEFINRVLDSYNLAAIQLKFADMTVNLNNGPRESLRTRYEKNIVLIQRRLQNMEQ